MVLSCRNRTASSVISENHLPLCDSQIGQRDRNQPAAEKSQTTRTG
jgi:hypothetical protein